MSFIKLLRRISILFILLCLPFLIWQFTQLKKNSLQYLDQQGTVHTLSLTKKDRKRLFDLMHMLFASDSFAYTILGSKPISLSCFRTLWPFVDFERFRSSLSNYHRMLRLGWKTWEKYQHLFPSANLWIETSKSDPGYVSIFIINEEQFIQVINVNKQDFHEELHRDIVDGFQLLNETKNRSQLYEVLQGHQALLGIVLGYGRENSWEFQRRCEKREFFYWVWDEKHEEIPGQIVTLKVELNTIEDYLEHLSIPSFAGYPHSEESMALKKDYLETKQKIINYYKGKDFLEATLSLLAGYRPKESM